MQVKRVDKKDKRAIDRIVDIHLKTFKGFFLTFLGKGFLRLMYSCYTVHTESDLLVATEENGEILGFAAYSSNLSGLYKFMLGRKFLPFVWYAFLAFLRRPKTFFRLFRALGKSKEVARTEKYVELSSIGVDPDYKRGGVGSALISYLKTAIDYSEFAYLTLETDADNNEGANSFYQKNGFKMVRTYQTREGRKMNEYRYRDENTVS